MPVNQVNNLQNSSFDGDSSGVSNNNSLIDKQYNFFLSVTNENNKTIITLDTEKFKEEYNYCYSMCYDEIREVFCIEDIDSRYTEKLLSELLNIKLKFLENKNFSFEIITKHYSELQLKIKETKNVDLKLNFLGKLEKEKTKCKELSLLFTLVSNNIICVENREDIEFIICCLNSLLVYDLSKIMDKNQKYTEVLRDYLCAFVPQDIEFNELTTKEDLKIFQKLSKSNIFENLFIPSWVILSNKTKKGYGTIGIEHMIRKKIGILSKTDFRDILKDYYFKSKLYTHVIRRLVEDNLTDCEIDYNDYFNFYNNDYVTTLKFKSCEEDLRDILKKKNFSILNSKDELNFSILDLYNSTFENPI